MMDQNRQDSLIQVVEDTLSTGDTSEWQKLVREGQLPDPFAPVLDARVVNRIYPGGFEGFDSWIAGIEGWLSTMQHSPLGGGPENNILYSAWDYFSTNLSEALREARTVGDIPRTGGVLAFVGGLSKCVVLDYAFSGTIPRLIPVTVIGDPQSALDLWLAMDAAASPLARNRLKTGVGSGHKIIAHNQILIHVDRRSEAEVFGPSIDTLLMVEVLTSYLLPGDPTVKSALEVGSGSGMLGAAVAKYAADLEQLYAIDIEMQAISCTDKNLRINRPPSNLKEVLIKGEFDPAAFAQKFDLIVCNPPYVPELTYLAQNHRTDRLSAVAGLDLIALLLATAEELLSPEGRMLLMTSEVALTETLDMVPPSLEVDRPLGDEGHEVLFDVEAVLIREEWLEALLSQNKIRKDGEAFVHRLHPLWILPRTR